MESPTVLTAVVLQGGGALGAYELGVLEALYEHRPGFRPAVVSGTSTGAVTAAVLAGARGDPISALERDTANFCRHSFEARIRAGHEDATAQGLGSLPTRDVPVVSSRR